MGRSSPCAHTVRRVVQTGFGGRWAKKGSEDACTIRRLDVQAGKPTQTTTADRYAAGSRRHGVQISNHDKEADASAKNTLSGLRWRENDVNVIRLACTEHPMRSILKRCSELIIRRASLSSGVAVSASGHRSAFAGALAARFCTPFAMLNLVLVALCTASVAEFGAQRADGLHMAAPARHGARGETAGCRAVYVKPNAFPHLRCASFR
jgi:hypothetical protein